MAEGAPTALSIEDVSFAWPGHPVLRGLSLDVATGEVVALAGPSGCGKSTLLRLVAGLAAVTGGRIVLRGRVLSGRGVHLDPSARGVGMVFQDAALFPHMTVAQNVLYGCRAGGGAPERRERLRELLLLFALEGMERRYPHQLSGGQQQRVAVARALAPRPTLLLMDEAFAGIDRRRKAELFPLLGRLLRMQATTVLFASHDADEAVALADRIAMMEEGRIAQAGAPEELAANPATPSIAAYFAPLPRSR